MKKNFLLILIFCFSFLLPAVEAEVFSLKNGIPVYIKNNEESDLTAVYLVIKGGVKNLTPETSGLEKTVLDLMVRGSKNYSYEKIKAFCYETQGSFTSYTIQDGSVFGMTCINKYFDATFDCFSDAYFFPLFSETQYDLLMQEVKQGIVSQMNEPASMLFYYMDQIIYEGHPYAANTNVTQDSFENITLSSIKEYYQSLKDSRRLSIVVSGNIDSEKLISSLNSSFGNLKSLNNSLKDEGIPEINISGLPLVLAHQSIDGAGHIVRVFSTPKVTDPDYPVARVASNIYSDILFNVVREKYGICYTPSSDISSSDAPYGLEFLYRVSNLDNFIEALNEARSMMEKGLVISGKDKKGNHITENLDKNLTGYKNSYINKKYASQANVSGVAARMAASLLQFGDIDSADKLTDIVKNCTVEDVLRVFKKYWCDEKGRWFAVVGPEDEERVLSVLNLKG